MKRCPSSAWTLVFAMLPAARNAVPPDATGSADKSFEHTPSPITEPPVDAAVDRSTVAVDPADDTPALLHVEERHAASHGAHTNSFAGKLS